MTGCVLMRGGESGGGLVVSARPVLVELCGERGIGGGEQRHGEQRGVGGAGLADRERRHRDAGGHLHDAVQAVLTGEMLARYRHAEHRHRRLRREHARQMRRAAGTGDDRSQPAVERRFGEGEHLVGHAVRRQHLRLVRHAELGEHLDRSAHGRPIAGRPHHDRDEGSAHPDSLARRTSDRCADALAVDRRRRGRGEGRRSRRRARTLTPAALRSW